MVKIEECPLQINLWVYWVCKISEFVEFWDIDYWAVDVKWRADKREDKDFNKILAKYKGKWVTLSEENRVVSSGYNAKKVYKEAKEKGIEVPTLFKVPNPQLLL